MHVEQASELHQLPWVAVIDQEIVVSIPDTPTDIQAFATSAPAFASASMPKFTKDKKYLTRVE